MALRKEGRPQKKPSWERKYAFHIADFQKHLFAPKLCDCGCPSLWVGLRHSKVIYGGVVSVDAN